MAGGIEVSIPGSGEFRLLKNWTRRSEADGGQHQGDDRESRRRIPKQHKAKGRASRSGHRRFLLLPVARTINE
jgi:hypothetical protein